MRLVPVELTLIPNANKTEEKKNYNKNKYSRKKHIGLIENQIVIVLDTIYC